MNIVYKVYCLENTPQHGPCMAEWKIKAGETYQVIGEHVLDPEWGLYLELSHQPDVCYPSEYFVRLPDQSADEMQEQEREGIVNLENVSACQK